MMNFLNVKLIFISCLLIFTNYTTAFAQVIIRSAPATGEGFTDDYKVMLEERESETNALRLAEVFSAGFVKEKPWSDSYWPTYRGIIAHRYTDNLVPENKIWSDHYRYYRNNPPNSFINANQINELSPAEKYDLLIGDTNWTLTKYLWQKGQKDYDKFGFVPTWTGICHGWAAAAQIGIPQPESDVAVWDYTGRHKINFRKFDLQALASYLWSRPRGEDLFTGRRCRKINVTIEDDRIVEPECIDVNPMTWHLAVMNRTGQYGRSMVMDTTFDSEVWNFVVDSYQTQYFNPATMEFTNNPEEAIVPVAQFPHIKWGPFRNPNTVKVMGVVMDVFHPNAVTPSGAKPPQQILTRKRFVYDLELDQNNNIIGGEWYGRSFPDFLWIFPDKFNPFKDEGAENPAVAVNLDGEFTLEEFRKAKELSSRGLVSPSIIYKLLYKSLTN